MQQVPPEREHDRTSGRPNGRTRRARGKTRYSFEFFQDQIETLKRLALEEKIAGESGNMSEMVREAVDMYIARKQEGGT